VEGGVGFIQQMCGTDNPVGWRFLMSGVALSYDRGSPVARIVLGFSLSGLKFTV
jgi:hypothetical protein